jgi:ketosteroid isomerase-like protein
MGASRATIATGGFPGGAGGRWFAVAMTDTASVATSCLEAWTTGNFDALHDLLDDDVTFLGPLGETHGADEYVEQIQGMAKLVDRADVHQVVADGDDVVLVYDLVTKNATVPTAGWYRLRDGRIVSVRAFFDPRPLLR